MMAGLDTPAATRARAVLVLVLVLVLWLQHLPATALVAERAVERVALQRRRRRRNSTAWSASGGGGTRRIAAARARRAAGRRRRSRLRETRRRASSGSTKLGSPARPPTRSAGTGLRERWQKLRALTSPTSGAIAGS